MLAWCCWRAAFKRRIGLLSKFDLIYGKDVLRLTLVIVASVSSIMFVFRLFAFADFISLSQDGAATLVLFFVFLFPAIFKLTIPVSLLLASLVVTLRMSADREIEALMSSGASLWRVARAPLVLGFLAMLASLYTGLYLEPYSRQQMSQFRWMQAVRGLENFISSRLDDKVFLTDMFPLKTVDMALYFDQMDDKTGDLTGVFLSVQDKETEDSLPLVLFGESGSLRKEEREGFPDFVFRVNRGFAYQPSAASSESLSSVAEEETDKQAEAGYPSPVLPSLEFADDAFGPIDAQLDELLRSSSAWDVFEFNTLRISLFSLFRRQTLSEQSGEVDIRTLQPREYLEELSRRRSSDQWGKKRRYVRDHTYFYEAATIPFACIFLPVIGLCIGISDPRRKVGYAYLTLGIVMFIYYASAMLCQQLAYSFVLAPEVTLWFPPLVIIVMTFLMMRARSVYPPSVRFSESILLDFRILHHFSLDWWKRLKGTGG